MTAGGLEPADSQETSYRRSATRGSCLVSIRTVRGRTVSTDRTDIKHKHKHKNRKFNGECPVLVHDDDVKCFVTNRYGFYAAFTMDILH
jgi:hypothetical protein